MAAKPKHPNAKTYTNKATGKVTPIKAKPAKKVVRPPAVNPLDAAVTSAVNSQVLPYENASADRARQYEADASNSEAINARMQQNLVGIQQTLATANNDALGLAAQRGTASADQMARNQSFLSGVLGNYVGDGGVGLQGAAQHSGVQVAADAAGNTRSVYDAGQAANGNLASQRSAMTLAQGERAGQLLQQRLADQRSIANEIARIRGQAPMLKRQFGREDEELRIAKEDLGLRRQQVSDARAANQAQTELGYYQTDASLAGQAAGAQADAAKDAKANAGRFGYNIDKKYDDAIAAVMASVGPTAILGPDGQQIPNPNHAWRSTIKRLQSEGLTGGQAVLLASKWLPDRLKIHGDKSPSVIYKILKSGELGFKLSDAVAKQVFQLSGLNWAHRLKAPKKPKATVSVPVRPGRPGSNVSAGDIGGGGAVRPGDLNTGTPVKIN